MKIYQHNKIDYDEVAVKAINEVDGALLEKLKKIVTNLKDNGACVPNAILVAQTAGCECVEGFVICVSTSGYPGAIRHCWNKIGEDHFDLTKEFVWCLKGSDATFYYFQLGVFNPASYGGKYDFQSDAIKLAGEIQPKVNTEAKEVKMYNYVNFYTKDGSKK